MTPVNVSELANQLVVNLELQIEWATTFTNNPELHKASLTQYVVTLGSNIEALFTQVAEDYRFCGCILDCSAYTKEAAEDIKTHALAIASFKELGVEVWHVSEVAERILKEHPATLEAMKEIAKERAAELETLTNAVEAVTVDDTPKQGIDIEEAETSPVIH